MAKPKKLREKDVLKWFANVERNEKACAGVLRGDRRAQRERVLTVTSWPAAAIGVAALALLWWATSWQAAIAVLLMIVADKVGVSRPPKP